jgi:hypothetical protein
MYHFYIFVFNFYLSKTYNDNDQNIKIDILYDHENKK